MRRQGEAVRDGRDAAVKVMARSGFLRRAALGRGIAAEDLERIEATNIAFRIAGRE